MTQRKLAVCFLVVFVGCSSGGDSGQRRVIAREALGPVVLERATDDSQGEGLASSESLAENPELSAPHSSVLPLLDGVVEGDEGWADAAVHELRVTGGVIRLMLKTYTLTPQNAGESQCTLYANNPTFQVPCGDYLLLGAIGLQWSATDAPLGYWELRIDEGHNTLRGSGPYDNQLRYGQDDIKWELGLIDISCGQTQCPYCREVFGKSEGCPKPACAPWAPEDCWRCADNYTEIDGNYCQWSSDPSQTATALLGSRPVPLDGFFLSATSTASTSKPEEVNYLLYRNHYGTQLEQAIPFHGLDIEKCPEGHRCDDLSDLFIEAGDTFGVRLDTSMGVFPMESGRWNPTQWARIHTY
jgi:hypothetical protein